MEDFILRQEELVQNPSARLPVCLVLDTSGSMAGESIAELQKGVETFFEAIRSDEVAKYSAEICVVTFGDSAKKVVDFAAIERQELPTVCAAGQTPMGAGVTLALDLLEARKTEYRNAGVDYFQPWMVLMTDGDPTDDISAAARRIESLVAEKKLAIFAIGIGPSANMVELARLSHGRPPLHLKGLNFPQFFVWLSRSVSRVSQSIPGEIVPLDKAGIDAWGQV
jgi:uncharacterized protein YegL